MRSKSISLLLVLILVLSLFLPQLGALATNTSINPPGKMSAKGPNYLALKVDKTEAEVGDTLTFTASWNLPGDKVRIVLWILKGKERVAILHESPGNRWEYKVEAPGVYKGMAISIDRADVQHYKDSELITVTVPPTPVPVTPEPVTPEPPTPEPPTPEPPTPEPPTPEPPTPEPPTPEPEIPLGEMKTMGLSHLLAIKPVADFTMLEGTAINPIPVVVQAKPEVRDINVKVRGLEPVLRWSRRLFSMGMPGLKGHILSKREPPLYHPGRKVENKDGNQVYMNPTMETLFWNAEELVKHLVITITATGKAGGEEGSVSHSFKIRYLRDANRNGIADIYEGQAGNVLQLSQINDRTVIASEPINPLTFFAINGPEVKWPVSYGLPQAPKGLKIRTEKGEPFTSGIISGKFNINWAEYEVSRDVLVKYSGEDQEGHTAQNAFIAKVLRDDNKDGLPDRVLSVEPIPDQMVFVGGKLHVPITIRSNLGGDIEVDVTRTWVDTSKHPSKFRITSPKEENASLKQVSGPLYGANATDKLYHFLYSSDSWCSNYRNSLDGAASGGLAYSVWVTCGEHQVSERFRLMFLDPEGSSPKIRYQFAPVPDSKWTEQEQVHIRLELNRMEEGISFRAGSLPPGLSLDTSIPSISGQFDIRDWQPGETQRSFPITAYALYKADGNKKYELWSDEMVAVTSFYVTAKRIQFLSEDADKPKAIPDQTVINLHSLFPIHVTCNHPAHTLQIKDIKGLPPGDIGFGPGNYIEGKVDVNDWGENEDSREFPVTVTTQCKASPAASPDGVPSVSLPVTETLHFTMKVLKNPPQEGEGGKGGGEDSPAPGFIDIQAIMDSFLLPLEETAKSLDEPSADAPEDVPEDIPEDIPADIPEDVPEEDISIPPPPPPAPKRLEVKEGLGIAILQSEETGEQKNILQGALSGLMQAGYQVGKNLDADFFLLSDEQFDPELLTQKTYALAIVISQPALTIAQDKLAAGIPLVVLGVDKPALTRPATGVNPAVPASDLLEYILDQQPEVKTIGCLYTDEAGQLDALTTLANELSLSVQSAAAPDAAQYAQQGLKLLEGADLLILAQPVPGEEVLSQLQEGAKKPVYIPAAEPFGMGRQGGWLAARVLSGEDFSALPFEDARSIIIN